MSQHAWTITSGSVPDLDEVHWADPALKERLLRDPAAVLRERGVTSLPPDLPRRLVYEVVRIVSLLWVEGTILPLERFFIDPQDEGLLFGRGVWESTRTVNGVPWLWDAHLDRLKKTAELLDIKLAPERLPDSKQVTDFVRALTGQDVVIRLNVTAGPPGRRGLVWMSAALRSQPVASVRLKTVRSPVEKGQPYLTWKTFQYATRLRTGQQVQSADFDTALLLDDQENVLEASHANIFLRLPDGWVTPTADGGLLPGTLRRHLLDHSPLPIREQVVPVSRLAGVSEVFLTNSNVGIVPVIRIDDRTYPIGDETRQLTEWLHPRPPKGAAQGPAVGFVRPRE